jgi:transglutaminase-like putative cysteine protease
MASTKKRKPVQNIFKLSYRTTWLLWFCQLINIISLSAEISWWMLVMLTLCLCGQASVNYANKLPNQAKASNRHNTNQSNRSRKTSISPLLVMLFAVSGCIVIAITVSTYGVLISMVHLLTFAYVLKAFELKQRKDFYQLSLLGLFLLASAFIFKQNLVFSLFILAALLLNLTLLLQIFTPTKSIRASVKTITLLLIQSSLLAIILFVFFPRLSPFWQVPNAKSAQTGLSDEVSPGDIASLALSNELAFRVDFKGKNIPSYSSLYWRAMTLENYDGRKWTRRAKPAQAMHSSKVTANNSFTPIISGESIAYDVIVEPSYQFWLFSLSVATSNEPSIRLVDDYTMQSRSSIGKISHYAVESYLQSPLDLTITTKQKDRNLAIIKGSNPKLEALAATLITKYPEPVKRSNAVLTLLREQEYFYTLAPPLLINNSLDQFFFDTKAGFCVHYASAYTFLMRAAGIPARIVTGYLGGEYNDINSERNAKQGGHLSVYQYDAHAWAEIWLEGIGWQRVDPTAAVDPERVESGWSTTLLNQQSSLSNNLLGRYEIKNIAWLNHLRLQFDALDYKWTRWVLGYSNEQQYNLLKRWFGHNIYWKAAIGIVTTFVILVLLFFLINRFNFSFLQRNKLPIHLALYQKLIYQLSKKGLAKPIDTTPTNFAQIVAQHYPEISQDFIEFTRIFEVLMYRKSNTEDNDELERIIKKQYDKVKTKLKIS